MEDVEIILQWSNLFYFDCSSDIENGSVLFYFLFLSDIISVL